MGHYGATPEATTAYSGDENGDCEQGHRRFKEELDQALLLRGSRDFRSREEYLQFMQALVGRRNARRALKFAEEQARLRALPARRLEALGRPPPRGGPARTVQGPRKYYSGRLRSTHAR